MGYHPCSLVGTTEHTHKDTRKDEQMGPCHRVPSLRPKQNLKTRARMRVSIRNQVPWAGVQGETWTQALWMVSARSSI